MLLPSASDINPTPENLDEKDAVKHFLGKTVEEAVALFRENGIYYQEDMMWMGPIAFRFYLPAVILYLRSEDSCDISDFVAHFASTLEFRLKYEPHELISETAQLIQLCDYLLDNWSIFEEGIAPYGDVRSRYVSLREVFLSMIQA